MNKFWHLVKLSLFHKEVFTPNLDLMKMRLFSALNSMSPIIIYFDRIKISCMKIYRDNI